MSEKISGKTKGQMSLEMVIGLLILLVVAAVVIKIFLGSVGNIGTIDDLKKANEYKDFQNQCESLCEQFKATNSRAAAAKYCSYKFQGSTSLKQNLLNKPVESDTKPGIFVCPNAIYCFHAKECDTDSGPIDWGDCKSILCQTYYDSLGDYGKASLKLQELIPNAGSCTIPVSQTSYNWFNQFGFAFPACGGVIAGTTTTTTTGISSVPSVSCIVASSSSITCTWSCPNAISQSNTGVLAVDKINQAVTLTTQTGSFTFTGLNPGTKYNIGLVCDPQTGKLVGSYSITI